MKINWYNQSALDRIKTYVLVGTTASIIVVSIAAFSSFIKTNHSYNENTRTLNEQQQELAANKASYLILFSSTKNDIDISNSQLNKDTSITIKPIKQIPIGEEILSFAIDDNFKIKDPQNSHLYIANIVTDNRSIAGIDPDTYSFLEKKGLNNDMRLIGTSNQKINLNSEENLISILNATKEREQKLKAAIEADKSKAK